MTLFGRFRLGPSLAARPAAGTSGQDEEKVAHIAANHVSAGPLVTWFSGVSCVVCVEVVALTAEPSSLPSSALTPREAAEELGVAAATIRRWIHERRLPCERVGGRYRIEEAALERVRVQLGDEEHGA